MIVTYYAKSYAQLHYFRQHFLIDLIKLCSWLINFNFYSNTYIVEWLILDPEIYLLAESILIYIYFW